MIDKSPPLFHIDAEGEVNNIVDFLRNVINRSGKSNIVIGWSGGIDSTVSLHLLIKAISPQNIFVYHLPYEKSYWSELIVLSEKLEIPSKNIREIAIKKPVDEIGRLLLKIREKNRIGNIMARVRMIALFDQAKEHDALVCGTENRTEHLLGYFTRYGDAASDIEPVVHLYKTQVYQVAAHLGISKEIINRVPTADLWEGQTDEDEFGFTYKDADRILYRYIDQLIQIKQIEAEGFKNTKKVIDRYKRNLFKQQVPYILS